jgi:hypothetical protein
MKSKTILAGVICFYLISISVVFARDFEKEIRAEGMADITAGNVAGARDRAIEDALRKAVEDGVGFLLSAESIVENYQLIQDTILSKSKGYVKNYKIINEKQKAWMYHVTISAKIGKTLLKDDLDALRRIKELKGNPRLMIIMEERVEGGRQLNQTENAMIQAFLDKEFKVVDPKAVKESIERDRLMRAIESDNQAAAALGLQHGADMVIMGSSVGTTHAIKVDGVDLKSISLSATARVIRADTGEVLIGKTETARAPQATSFGRQLAVEEISDNLSSFLIPKIVEIWNDELINLNSITLTAIGLDSYEKISEVKRFLKANIRNLKRVYDRGFVQSTAKFELMIRGGSSRKLAEDLTLKKGSNYRFKVKNVEANSLTVAVLPLNTDEPVILTVEGLDTFDKVVKVKRFLQSNIADLKEIKDQGYVQNTAKMELMIRGGSAQKLAEALTENKGPDYRFEVNSVEANSLTVKMSLITVEAPSAHAKEKGLEPSPSSEEDVQAASTEKARPPVEVKAVKPAAEIDGKPEIDGPQKLKGPVEVEKYKSSTPVRKKSKISEPRTSNTSKTNIFSGYVRVKVDWMNVREFPDPGFKKVGKAKRNEKFPLVDTVHPKPGSTWYEIKYKGKRAYVSYRMVELVKGN